MFDRKEWHRKWRLAHPEYSREWREKNREKANEYSRAYRAKNPHKVKETNQKQRERRKTWTKEQRRDKQRKYAFGIPEGWFAEQLQKQGGVCAICGNPSEVADSMKRDLHVDHDHKTGQVRGLLCGKCNPMLGLVDDSISLLEKAIEYLKKHHVKTQ